MCVFVWVVISVHVFAYIQFRLFTYHLHFTCSLFSSRVFSHVLHYKCIDARLNRTKPSKFYLPLDSYKSCMVWKISLGSVVSDVMPQCSQIVMCLHANQTILPLIAKLCIIWITVPVSMEKETIKSHAAVQSDGCKVDTFQIWILSRHHECYTIPHFVNRFNSVGAFTKYKQSILRNQRDSLKQCHWEKNATCDRIEPAVAVNVNAKVVDVAAVAVAVVVSGAGAGWCRLHLVHLYFLIN